MNEGVLLDTSVVVAHFREDASLATRFKESALYIPLIVLGELLYGAYLVSFQAKALRQIEEFLRICAVLVPNEETAHHYGRINAQLHKTPAGADDFAHATRYAGLKAVVAQQRK
jgi:predicted nucleic acid-binding protein